MPANKEENGKCEIKYFDPTENRIETMCAGMQAVGIRTVVQEAELPPEVKRAQIEMQEDHLLRQSGGGALVVGMGGRKGTRDTTRTALKLAHM